jgi:biopolymer transport protein ExbD
MTHAEVEIQVAPMLDMAFQLLTFFILTYRPMPVEGQFAMNLLPPSPVMDINAQAPESGDASASGLPAALRTLTTNLHASPDGTLARIGLGESEFDSIDGLRARLKEIVADKTLPFDQALIQVDPNLRYEELMRVIEAFSGPGVGITKLSFGVLGDQGMPGL